MEHPIFIGTRDSQLAMQQSTLVRDYIQTQLPTATVALLPMKTTGDKILDVALDKIGGKGLFVKELDHALRTGKSQLSVHSLKDMPMEIPTDLPLLVFSKREDPRDALLLPLGATAIDFTKPIGCSSNRRILQLKKLYPQATFAPIRGNVQTRLAKLDSGAFGATVLAAAGLNRLHLAHRITRCFSPTEMLPAAGQGILAVQGRAGNCYDYLAGFDDATARAAALAERSFVKTLNGGCSSPIAAYATVAGDTLTLTGLYYDPLTQEDFIDCITGNVAQADALGVQLALRLQGKDRCTHASR